MLEGVTQSLVCICRTITSFDLKRYPGFLELLKIGFVFYLNNYR